MSRCIPCGKSFVGEPFSDEFEEDYQKHLADSPECRKWHKANTGERKEFESTNEILDFLKSRKLHVDDLREGFSGLAQYKKYHTKEYKMRDITIKSAMNGYIVKVGYNTVVFESKKKLLSELKAYLDDPEKTETRYEKDKINSGSNPPEPPRAHGMVRQQTFGGGAGAISGLGNNG